MYIWIHIIYLIISQALILLHSPKKRNSECPSTWYLTNGEHYTHWADGHSLLNQPKWCDQPKLHLPTFWLISRFTNQSTLSILSGIKWDQCRIAFKIIHKKKLIFIYSGNPFVSSNTSQIFVKKWVISLHILSPWRIQNKFPDPDFQKSSWWFYLATWDVMTSWFFPVLFGIYSRVNLSKLVQNDKAEENPVVRGVIVSISLASSKKTDKTKTQQPKLHLFLPIEIISQVVKPKTSGRLFFSHDEGEIPRKSKDPGIDFQRKRLEYLGILQGRPPDPVINGVTTPRKKGWNFTPVTHSLSAICRACNSIHD